MSQAVETGSFSLHGKTKRGHSPQDAPKDLEGRAWKKEDHLHFLPDPGCPFLCPLPPPSTLAQHRSQRLQSSGRRSQGTPLTNSPLEFWELLFVSSKWFCALPSTRRLKRFLLGGGGERARKKKTTVTDQCQVREGACQRGAAGEARDVGPCPSPGLG